MKEKTLPLLMALMMAMVFGTTPSYGQEAQTIPIEQIAAKVKPRERVKTTGILTYHGKTSIDRWTTEHEDIQNLFQKVGLKTYSMAAGDTYRMELLVPNTHERLVFYSDSRDVDKMVELGKKELCEHFLAELEGDYLGQVESGHNKGTHMFIFSSISKGFVDVDVDVRAKYIGPRSTADLSSPELIKENHKPGDQIVACGEVDYRGAFNDPSLINAQNNWAKKHRLPAGAFATYPDHAVINIGTSGIFFSRLPEVNTYMRVILDKEWFANYGVGYLTEGSPISAPVKVVGTYVASVLDDSGQMVHIIKGGKLSHPDYSDVYRYEHKMVKGLYPGEAPKEHKVDPNAKIAEGGEVVGGLKPWQHLNPTLGVGAEEDVVITGTDLHNDYNGYIKEVRGGTSYYHDYSEVSPNHTNLTLEALQDYLSRDKDDPIRQFHALIVSDKSDYIYIRAKGDMCVPFMTPFLEASSSGSGSNQFVKKEVRLAKIKAKLSLKKVGSAPVMRGSRKVNIHLYDLTAAESVSGQRELSTVETRMLRGYKRSQDIADDLKSAEVGSDIKFWEFRPEPTQTLKYPDKDWFWNVKLSGSYGDSIHSHMVDQFNWCFDIKTVVDEKTVQIDKVYLQIPQRKMDEFKEELYNSNRSYAWFFMATYRGSATLSFQADRGSWAGKTINQKCHLLTMDMVNTSFTTNHLIRDAWEGTTGMYSHKMWDGGSAYYNDQATQVKNILKILPVNELSLLNNYPDHFAFKVKHLREEMLVVVPLEKWELFMVPQEFNKFYHGEMATMKKRFSLTNIFNFNVIENFKETFSGADGDVEMRVLVCDTDVEFQER